MLLSLRMYLWVVETKCCCSCTVCVNVFMYDVYILHAICVLVQQLESLLISLQIPH